MTLIHVVGARPNFMKASPVLIALDDLGIDQSLVHTGQHYDASMSQVFFNELGLPEPDRYLGVGSGSHAYQTARLLEGLEDDFIAHRPEAVVVYGDVNSTLAASLVAAKLEIPVAHVEAGLRSFDRTMPEEVNRVVTDALSSLHLVTSPEAIDHLEAEGIPDDGIRFVGNPMIDTLDRVVPTLNPAETRGRLDIGDDYVLVTLHRPANVDIPSRATEIVRALHAASERSNLIFPMHPRGRASLEAAGIADIDRLVLIDPLGYFDFVGLLTDARAVITDSGGIQEEATVLGVPCLTVRPNTERPITVTQGTNQLVEPAELPDALDRALSTDQRLRDRPPLWDGRAGPRAAVAIADWLEVLRREP